MNNENFVKNNDINILEKNKKEDKKYVKKYTAVMILCAVFGGFLGVASVKMVNSGGNLGTVDFSKMLSDTISMLAPYIMLSTGIVAGILILIFYRRSKSLYMVWDGEDERVIDNIEKKLSIGMAVLNCSMIIYYMMLAVYIGGLFKISLGSESLNLIFIVRFIIFLISFAIFMSMLHVSQKKLIDFEKEINPEKKGSVYDINFIKKWEESCDEAEKLCIYKSAWMSYKAVSMTCIILWVLCTFGMILFDFGIAPVFIVGIIWMVSSMTYVVNAAKMSE